MKIRTITGIVLTIFMICMVLFLPTWGMRLLFEAVSLVAMYELLSACACKNKAIIVAATLFAAACPFFDMFSNLLFIFVALILYALVLIVIQIACYDTWKLEQTLYVFAVSVMVVLPVSSLAYIRAIPDHGKAFMCLPLIIAWFSDTGAYFAGSFFGKHKLCETISPKKTVEGFFGGILTAVIGSVIAALVYQLIALNGTGEQISYWMVALIAFVIAPISVVGDLFCSIIKRHFGIKDFGNIFPGHGGVLDRFDSLVFVAPLMYFVFETVPLIQ